MYFLATKQPKGMERHRGHQVYRGSQLVMLLWTVVVAASCSVGGIGGAASFKIWKLGWAYVETYTMVCRFHKSPPFKYLKFTFAKNSSSSAPDTSARLMLALLQKNAFFPAAICVEVKHLLK